MSGEIYQVIFNSAGLNAIQSPNLNHIIYSVNWGAFLDKKYRKFECCFTFKSINYNGTLTDNGFVNMNLGRTNNFDGSQMTSNIGIIYPVMVSSVAYYYNSTNNDNNVFMIDYPSNSQIMINLVKYNGVDITNMRDYIIILNLKGITDI